MMNNNNYGASEKPFNYALRFLEDIADEMKVGREMRRERNLVAWYHTLKSIFNMIHFKMIDADGVGDEKEKDLKEEFKKAESMFRGKEIQVKELNLNQCEKVLDNVELLINDLPFEYNLKYPKAGKKYNAEEKTIIATVQNEE